MTRWKVAERSIASLLGGKRVPITGRARGDTPDVVSERYSHWSIEVKNREIVPGFLLDALAQAKAAAKGDQIPVVILHKVGTPYLDSLKITRLRDELGDSGD